MDGAYAVVEPAERPLGLVRVGAGGAGACEDGSGQQTKEGCAANGFEDFDRIRFWTTPVSKCPGGDCVPYYRWVSDYIGVIGGR